MQPTDSSTFDVDAWLAGLDQDLLATPEGRRVLTRLDPLLFAVLYRERALKQGTKGITFADMHLELVNYGLSWVRSWDMNPMKGARDIFIAPRDSGKSTWLFNVLPMWAAAHEHVKFISAFSGTATQASRWLGNFKRQMGGTNKLLAYDFPELCIDPIQNTQNIYWAKSGFIFAAFGIDSSSLGTNFEDKRPDLLILDDIEKGEGNYSEYLASKRLSTVLTDILPMNHRAHTLMVGTTLMPDSLMHQAVKAAQGGKPKDWIAQEKFRVHHFKPILIRDDGTERSFWEGKFPLAELEEIKNTRTYRTDFENDPMSWGGQYWRDIDFEYGDVPGVTRWIVSIDPHVSDSEKSDFTGIAVVGYSPSEKKCVVAHAEEVKKSNDDIRRHVYGLIADRFPEVRGILVETNNGGVTWRSVYRDLPTGVKLIEQFVTGKKEWRAANALAFYQTKPRRVLHKVKLQRAEEQMIAYPRTRNDDLVDAVGAGVRYFLDPPKKIPTGIETF